MLMLSLRSLSALVLAGAIATPAPSQVMTAPRPLASATPADDARHHRPHRLDDQDRDIGGRADAGRGGTGFGLGMQEKTVAILLAEHLPFNQPGMFTVFSTMVNAAFE
jgi:hypothetical protein